MSETLNQDSEQHHITQQIRLWLENVVIGLNLCPFAGKPYRNQQVRITVCDATTEQALLETLQAELTRIDEQSKDKLETTLLVIPELLSEFETYNQFLDMVDLLLQEYKWEGEYQIASFHPQYCFAGVEPEAAENLTNRSPYPVLHILREDSLEQALDHYADPEDIPVRNIQRMEDLSEAEKRQLFPYLYPLKKQPV